MKKSKRSKASERENGVDFISNLPDPILHLILSALPTTEEVIRTSILSRRWRYPLNLPSFTGFPALRVLELNSVELLDDDEVETFLESCPLLEDLSLIDCLINKLDVLCISSPNLKTLRIDNRKMADYEGPDDVHVDTLKKKLYLYEDEGLCVGLQVCCPKLVVLEYAGHAAYKFFFENLDSLKKAVVYPEYMMQKELSFESMGDTICELFAGLSHVESLSINLYFVQCIDVARDPEGHFPASLPNLKTLELTTSIEAFTIDVLIRIIRSSPNLESLHLIIQEEFVRTEFWELDDTDKMNILTRHLKRVEFLEFNGENQKLVIARFLLEHGNALEEMVFSWCNEENYHEKSTETMKKMSKFHKASSTVKLMTLLKDSSSTVSSN